MQSKNLGLILYLKPIKDNDLYIKILSANDKVLSGLVYGGLSSKKKSIYQLGYFIEFNQLQKNINSVNSINGEIVRPFIADIYNDKFKSFSLLAIISILNEAIYDEVIINGLFESVQKLINLIIINKNWLSSFCEWLLYFLKLLGYGIDYKNMDMKYFNLHSLTFENKYNNSKSILFPKQLLNKNAILTYESVKLLFMIFETVFKKNHLNNYNKLMPTNYLNFKFLILKELKKNK